MPNNFIEEGQRSVRSNVYMSERMKKQLKAIAKAKGKSFSEIVRINIDKGLKQAQD